MSHPKQISSQSKSNLKAELSDDKLNIYDMARIFTDSNDSLSISRNEAAAFESLHISKETRHKNSEKGKSSSQNSTHCRKCEQKLEGDVVLASGKVYHLDHFRCNRCQKDISSCLFYEYDIQTLCQPCFFNTDMDQESMSDTAL